VARGSAAETNASDSASVDTLRLPPVSADVAFVLTGASLLGPSGHAPNSWLSIAVLWLFQRATMHHMHDGTPSSSIGL
jgi:hypothetical protein